MSCVQSEGAEAVILLLWLSVYHANNAIVPSQQMTIYHLWVGKLLPALFNALPLSEH